jgi:hypothetical protein
MNNKININDRSTFYASDNLIDQLKQKYTGEYIVNFAYTDYGGDFFDKVCISFFSESYPESIVVEPAIYFGQNAFLFGDVAKEFIEETENYLLGFDNLEEYYFNKEYEQAKNDFKLFIEGCEMYSSAEFKPDTLDYLLSEKSGYYNITTQGLDFCHSTLLNELIQTGHAKIKTDD